MTMSSTVGAARTLNTPSPAWTAARGSLALVGAAVVTFGGVLLAPVVGAAQSLGGTWTEALVHEQVVVRNWGPNCGPKPTAKGARRPGTPVQISAAGGVIAIPSAGIRSDTCKYVSVARKTAYSSGSYKLHCATPIDATPRESGVYTFTASADGKELRYKARVSVYWKLQGDICEAEANYERLYQRPEPSEPVAVVEPAEPEPTEPAETAARRRGSAAAPKLTPSEDNEAGIVLIPVEAERGAGPSGGAATPVVTTRRRAEARQPVGLWIGLGVGGLLLGAVAAFALAWMSRRRPTPIEASAPASNSANPAPRRTADPNAAYARTMLLQAVSAAREHGSSTLAGATAPGLPRDNAEAPGATDRLDTAVAAMACTRCDRHYEMGAEYCPYDGQRLEPVEDHAPPAELPMMVCPRCGRRYPHEASFCPEDGMTLVALEDSERPPASAPLLICATCHREFMAGTTRCPDDDGPLLPLVGRRTLGLPVVGAGPRSLICPTCGTRYPADVTFCGKDGVSLVNVN